MSDITQTISGTRVELIDGGVVVDDVVNAAECVINMEVVEIVYRRRFISIIRSDRHLRYRPTEVSDVTVH